MDAKELLKVMGFEHEQHTDRYEHEPDKLVTSHFITHPAVPGLFLSGQSLEKAAKHIVWAIITLAQHNKKFMMPVQEMKNDNDEIL